MFSKMLCRFAFVCVIASAAAAQNPTVVEPTHYVLKFQNDRVEVVYIHYGPHEKSGLHQHPGGVVVSLTAAHLRFTDQNGKTQEVLSRAGEARWFPPFRHRVENVGDNSYEGIYIGVKNPPGCGSSKAELEQQSRQVLAEVLAQMPDSH